MGIVANYATDHPWLVAISAGAAVHVTVFIKGEWHMQAPWLATILLGTFAAALTTDLYRPHFHPLSLFSIVATFYIGLLTSIVIYRLFFHKLHRFPGPFGAKISKLWHTLHCLDSRQHIYLHSLHKKYGSIVRTGPRELMIITPDIFELLDDPRNQSHKTDWYDLLRPAKAVISERDPAIHNKRRKIWDKALNAASLAEYKPLLNNHVQKLLDNIDESSAGGKPVLANDVFYWFAFDVVSELALGKTFGMQEERKWHQSTLHLRSGMGLLGIASSVPWLARVAFAYVPNFPVIRDWFALQDFLKEKMTERVHRGLVGKDIAEHFIESVGEENKWTEEDWQWVHGDGMNVLIAGSETTAATITFLFSQLAKDKALANRLHRSLEHTEATDLKALRENELLNGIINETLRLYPALPSAAYRETLEDGLKVGDTWIPGGTKIIAPRYSVARLEAAFPDAESFIPERWMDKPELVPWPKAFAPFATGRYSCVGRQLALNEIRMTTASIIQKYAVALAPGEDGEAVISEMKDQMAVFPGPLRLAFSRRED
ncbi:Tryprostatin B 6-hydroxylase [Cercospora beticola]|uniref:Tryprostatin B 6-hydroxylase n=1 Tax=Cercospora beticola TaxID=122368 RepID=A0A2G5I0U4_CERBT|nr:Tryprostatin B 6-hydroxylase [Cercospora beticola]PIA98388.1 Tryprostatin B 6-hydroxylase [Cercospora beticola]WPA99322.1 hypothetical protein RHO25_003939 [Cercospora beticola]CAK1360646.1 unnamed protein product [Cercospora beticola]